MMFIHVRENGRPSGTGGRYNTEVMPTNIKAAINRLSKGNQANKLLKMSGIATAKAGPEPGTRIYRVQLYQFHLLHLEKSLEKAHWLSQPWGEQHFEPVERLPNDPEAQVAVKLAVRALYATGLECGEVLLTAASPHRVKVVRVSPYWPAQMSDRFMREARDWWLNQRKRRSADRLMLGADPEFALRGVDGTMVLASDYMGKGGVVGCDSTRYREELALHQHPLAELRPEPSDDPDELFARIRQALLLARRKITDRTVEWLAGGMPFDGYPVGGHIHFSGVALDFSLLRKLDAYLALPLVMVEDPGCLKRRPRYGFLGDIREKTHGGFEYRTLPSWLVHPDVTRGILHLARLVAACHEQLTARPHLDVSLIRAYYRGDKQTLAPYVKAIWEELSSLACYRDSRDPLDCYFAYLLAGETWPAGQDLRKAWEIG
ncbi:Phage phiEco32-like COOH-NH2 ligase-type 2 [Brevibacillus aydinogluensis]|jgi:hypothetical protein|uniref:Phage phiEco32-like COOH-NH2 ligase-type 2 n=2 Tax=Brevibacillus aydinogluensis TaxID=927786 RepID=A0AA48M950_9BACL|nr:Phage phiEco32-like COOH-NH2 ligase-type 2 [Brevibacillus aydinogluensis]